MHICSGYRRKSIIYCSRLNMPCGQGSFSLTADFNERIWHSGKDARPYPHMGKHRLFFPPVHYEGSQTQFMPNLKISVKPICKALPVSQRNYNIFLLAPSIHQRYHILLFRPFQRPQFYHRILCCLSCVICTP